MLYLSTEFSTTRRSSATSESEEKKDKIETPRNRKRVAKRGFWKREKIIQTLGIAARGGR